MADINGETVYFRDGTRRTLGRVLQGHSSDIEIIMNWIQNNGRNVSNRILPRPVGSVTPAWQLTTANLGSGQLTINTQTELDIRADGKPTLVARRTAGGSTDRINFTIRLEQPVDMTNGCIELRMRYTGTSIPKEGALFGGTKAVYIGNVEPNATHSFTLPETRLTTGRWFTLHFFEGTYATSGSVGYDPTRIDKIQFNFTNAESEASGTNIQIEFEEIRLLPVSGEYGFGCHPIPYILWSDDGRRDTLTMAGIANNFGIPMSYAIISSYPDRTFQDNVTWDELHREAEEGNAIVNHTHNHIALTSPDTITSRQQAMDEVLVARDILESHGFNGRYLVIPQNASRWEKVYPDGSIFNITEDLLETKQLDGVRNTNDGWGGNGPNPTLFTRPKFISTGTSNDGASGSEDPWTLKDHLINCMAAKSPCCQLFHIFTPMVTPDVFREHMQYVHSLANAGLVVPVTINDVWDRIPQEGGAG